MSHRSWIEINLSAFADNFTALKKMAGKDKLIMQIVKADAYGHGAAEIAQTALENGAHSLGVANADEGALLRYQGINCPILILSPSLLPEIPLIVENELTPSVHDLAFVKALSGFVNSPYPVHLNIDSGMGRSGIRLLEVKEIINEIQKLDNVNLEGIFTHYSSAENDREFTKKQTEAFNAILSELTIKPAYVHYANSSAVISLAPLPGNLVRIGALSYGFYTDDSQKDLIDLKPVMSFYSRISQIKMIEKGEYVGYNRTYKCQRTTKTAIIPIGYADGYDFLLSNCGKVAVKNKLYPVIGKVSMDMIIIDITGSEDVKLGDEVLLMGNAEDLKVEQLTGLYGGSPYEMLCQTGRRARKLFYKEGELISSVPRLRREFVSFDYDHQKLNRIIESAISQRLQSSEIADFITEDLIKNIFRDRDHKIHYRHDFYHSISFLEKQSEKYPQYFTVNTELRYKKVLSGSKFIITCAKSEQELAKYLRKPEVEYRWLLDSQLSLDAETFHVNEVQVNGINLTTEYLQKDNCLEIHCQSKDIESFEGKEVEFNISTTTFYPRSYHQLSVFITDITCGYEIEFKYPANLKIENTIPIFSGREKFPGQRKEDGSLIVSSEDWVFPLSGIVFVYKLIPSEN